MIAHPLLEVRRRLDPFVVQPRQFTFERLFGLRPSPERRIGLGECRRRRDDLGHAIRDELVLDEPDEAIRGHAVQFDAAAGKQECDLVVVRAVDAQATGERVPVLVDGDAFKFEAEPLHVGESQPEIDARDLVPEL